MNHYLICFIEGNCIKVSCHKYQLKDGIFSFILKRNVILAVPYINVLYIQSHQEGGQESGLKMVYDYLYRKR